MNVPFLKENNAKQLWHPMSHPNKLDENPPQIITSGEGVYIEDVDGHRMVDAVGGLWNVNIGYGREEVKQAVIDQMDQLAYYSAFNGTTNPPAIELSHKLIEMMGPEQMKRVFFSLGGSDANETAMRLARQYWKMQGQSDRYKFISLKKGYHGTHFGAASINGNTAFRRNYEPLLPGCFHVETPHLYHNSFTDDPTKLGEICADLLEKEIIFQGPDTVAAFIAEPVQGAGGVIVPPENYWPLVREICDRHGVLLISDEVVTGFGRTGSLFGARGWGVQPDIMSLAKGISSGYIPLGATVVNERIDNAFRNNADTFGMIMHGYTYSGHPVACAAAIATLDIVLNEDLPANAAAEGAYLNEKLQAFVDRHDLVGDVRGKGLMTGIELVADKKTKAPLEMERGARLAEIVKAEGVKIRVSGNMIILSPPLVIQRPEIDKIIDALDIALSEVS